MKVITSACNCVYIITHPGVVTFDRRIGRLDKGIIQNFVSGYKLSLNNLQLLGKFYLVFYQRGCD
jgi:hypothetical protein